MNELTGEASEVSDGMVQSALATAGRLLGQDLGASSATRRNLQSASGIQALSPSSGQGTAQLIVNLMSAKEESEAGAVRRSRARALAFLTAQGTGASDLAARMVEVDAALRRARRLQQCGPGGSVTEFGEQVQGALRAVHNSVTAAAIPNEDAVVISASSGASSSPCNPTQGVDLTSQLLACEANSTTGIQQTMSGPGAGVDADARSQCGLGDLFGAAGGAVGDGPSLPAFTFSAAALPDSCASGSVALAMAEYEVSPFCADFAGESQARRVQELGVNASDLIAAPSSLASQTLSVTLTRDGSEVPMNQTAEPLLLSLPLSSDPGVAGLPLVLPTADSGRRLQYSDLLSEASAEIAVRLHAPRLSARQEALVRALQGRTGNLWSATGAHSGRRALTVEEADLSTANLTRVVQCPDNASAAWWAGGEQDPGWVDPYANGNATVAVSCTQPWDSQPVLHLVPCSEDQARGFIEYTCPVQAFTAGCVFFDEAAGQWSGEGCVLASLTNSHMTCACDHLTAFAARFRQLGASQKRTFTAGPSRFRDIADDLGGAKNLNDVAAALTRNEPHVLILVGALALAYVTFLFISNALDAKQERIFIRRLARDEEVMFMKHISSMAGQRWKLVQHLTDDEEEALVREALGTSQEDEAAEVTRAMELRRACPCGLAACCPSFVLQALDSCCLRPAQSMGVDKDPKGPDTDENDWVTAKIDGGVSSVPAFARRMNSVYRGVSSSGVKLAGATLDSHMGLHPSLSPVKDSLEARRRALDEDARHASDSFNVFVRCWQMRGLIVRAILLRLAFQHRYWSVFSRFDAKLSRAKRLTILFVAVLAAMCASAALFETNGIVDGQKITFGEVLVFAFISAWVQIPLALVAALALDWAAEAEFANAYTDLSREILRRQQVEDDHRSNARVSPPKKRELLEDLDSALRSAPPGDGPSARASASPGMHETFFALGDRMESQEEEEDGISVPKVVLQTHWRWEVDMCRSVRTSCALHQCCDERKSDFRVPEHPNDSDMDTDDELQYGWHDAPLCCLQNFPWLVKACGRHPSQRAMWLRMAREADFEPWGCCWVGHVREPPPPAESAASLWTKEDPMYALASAGSRIPTQVPSLSPSMMASAERLEARLEARKDRRAKESKAEAAVDDHDAADSFTSPAMLFFIFLQYLNVRCWCRRRAILGKARPATEDEMSATRAKIIARIHHLHASEEEGASSSACCGVERPPAGEPRWCLPCLDAICCSPCTRCCLCMGCCVTRGGARTTMSSLGGWESSIAWALAWSMMAAMLTFVLLFGLARGQDVLWAFLGAFGMSQGLAFGLVQPIVITSGVMWSLVLAPIIMHFFSWVPGVGNAVAPKGGRRGPETSSLSGRIESVSLVQAAGAASGLQPGAALLAYSVASAVGSVLFGAATAHRRRQEARAMLIAEREQADAELRMMDGSQPLGAAQQSTEDVSPAKFAMMVLQGKAPPPHTTTEMRRQLFLISAYLQRRYPGSVLQGIADRFAAALEQPSDAGKAHVYFKGTSGLQVDVGSPSDEEVPQTPRSGAGGDAVLPAGPLASPASSPAHLRAEERRVEEEEARQSMASIIAAAKREAAKKAAAEKAEADRVAAEKAEAERIAAEKAEAERIAAEKAEAERIAAEKAEAERIAAEKAEAERIAAEKAEADRVAAEKAEAERIAAEKAEADRIAAEKAEAERIAAEKAEARRHEAANVIQRSYMIWAEQKQLAKDASAFAAASAEGTADSSEPSGEGEGAAAQEAEPAKAEPRVKKRGKNRWRRNRMANMVEAAVKASKGQK